MRPDVAAELGLGPDVVVATGGQDQKCAALGAGIHDGVATLSLGTASAIVQVMDAPRTDPERRIPTFAFLEPRRWVLEGVVGTGAGSLRWHRDVLAPGLSYAALDEEAAAVPRGADGVRFHPHLSGATSPYWRAQVHGAYENLSLATTRRHLTRAVLEGVAFQIRANLEITQAIAGRVAHAVVFGGGAKSASVARNHLRCDGIAGVLDAERGDGVPGRGDAGGSGGGRIRFAAGGARARGSRWARRREPNVDATAEYDEWYERYAEAEARLMGERA